MLVQKTQVTIDESLDLHKRHLNEIQVGKRSENLCEYFTKTFKGTNIWITDVFTGFTRICIQFTTFLLLLFFCIFKRQCFYSGQYSPKCTTKVHSFIDFILMSLVLPYVSMFYRYTYTCMTHVYLVEFLYFNISSYLCWNTQNFAAFFIFVLFCIFSTNYKLFC